MKTKEEKLEICSTCTKRKFNPEKGLICSLTNEEPIFDDECPAFEADSDQLQKPKDNNTPQSISGWLTFFLWVGIGLGVIVSTKTAFNEIIIEGINWYLASAYATYIIALDIIAVYTIIVYSNLHKLFRNILHKQLLIKQFKSWVFRNKGRIEHFPFFH